ncbi:DNA-binding MarR family transcriptional regulator [Agromyces sp. 3263]|uniref:MarR family winged helix-turn-helix transcriptional regulator n=1 Tax=Agromyces sp. 3263 TaxID=2817750 RepID=UPI002863EF10|nr:MarR family transcriptional regulator [Agromyces sp. 3263]MDR6905240.1 DNA-binding MarR family transcriptional regulator [Agromyces sp. 3263]
MTDTASSAARTATDDEIASVEEQLRRLFGRVRLVWKEAAAAVHPDLQPVGYKILSALVRRGRMHAGAIAEVFEIDKSVVSRQVKHLESLGLARVVADPDDGRARFVEATDEAIASVEQKGSRMQQRLYARLRTWSGDDVETLATLLGRLGSEVVEDGAEQEGAESDANDRVPEAGAASATGD